MISQNNMQDLNNQEKIFIVFMLKKELKDLEGLGHTVRSPYVIALRKMLLKIEGVKII